MTVRVSTISYEDAVYEWQVEFGSATVVVMAELEFDARGRNVVLRAVHIQGGGANTVGPARLLAALRELKAVLGVDELGIEGAPRTTGANPGRTPRPVRV